MRPFAYSIAFSKGWPISKRHYRVTLADALSAHDRALQYGGIDGMPRPDLVQSALSRPYNGYYRSIERKAAALIESMATNHGFVDGNKRTTVILLHTLLTKSGYKLDQPSKKGALDDAVETLILDVVNHKMSFDQIVDWIKNRLTRI